MRSFPVHVLRCFGVASALCGCAVPSLYAAETERWEFQVLQGQGTGAFSEPALDILDSNGQIQVAYAQCDNAASTGRPGIYVQTVGGELQSWVKDDDVPPGPGDPTQRFRFDDCPRVSLSQGSVAFIGTSQSYASNVGVRGVYLASGPTSMRRVADTNTAIPGAPAFMFGDFGIGVSLSRGKLVFRGAKSSSLPGDWVGAYGDFGSGLYAIADLGSSPDLGFGRPTRFSDFGAAIAIASKPGGADAVAMSTNAVAGGLTNIRAQVLFDPARPASSAWTRLADSLQFGYDATNMFSPAVDVGGNSVFYVTTSGGAANPSGIYSGNGQTLEAVAFGAEGIWPATDAAPKQAGAAATRQWVAFTGAANGVSALYLWERDRAANTTKTSKVVDAVAMAKVIAPYLSTAIPPDTPLNPLISVYKEAVKEGVIAFRVRAFPGASDFIVLARRSTPTLVLKAIADTTVRADLDVRRNDNHGLQDYLEVGTGRQTNAQAEGVPDRMRSFVQFELSALPALQLNSAALVTTLHSFDNGVSNAQYTLDAHRTLNAWVDAGGEGNGYEGARPAGAAARLTDVDSASGMAWAGAGANTDPAAGNNRTQPPFDGAVLASQTVRRDVHRLGDRLEWDVTTLARAWLDKSLPNYGLALTDATTDGLFRGVRMGSREGEVYRMPGAVDGPRLELKWSVGVKPGDLTGDGCVDRSDLAVVMAVVAGQAVAGTSLAPKLDLNGDGRVDVADARRLSMLFTNQGGAACANLAASVAAQSTGVR